MAVIRLTTARLQQHHSVECAPPGRPFRRVRAARPVR